MINMRNVKWELEPDCNLNCKHCFVYDRFKVKSIPLNEAKNIVDKLISLGVNKINFTTKEPLIYNNFIRLVKYCTRNGVYTTVVSNGMKLCDEDFVRDLISAGIGGISISLEGIQEKSNDYIRGTGVLDKVLSAINCVDKVRKEMQSSIYICMNISINSLNLDEVDNFVQYFSKIPVDILGISKLAIIGNMKNNVELGIELNTFLERFDCLVANYVNEKEVNFELSTNILVPYGWVYYNLLYNRNFSIIIPNCGVFSNSFSLLV